MINTTHTTEVIEVCKRIVNKSSDIVFFLDEGVLLWSNLAGNELSGQLSSRVFLDTIHSADKDNVISTLQKTKESNIGEAGCTCRHFLKDDSIVSLDWTFSWLPDLSIISCLSKKSEKVPYFEDDKVARLEHLERKIMEHAMEITPNTIEVFHEYIQGIEEIFPDMKASILTVENGRLKNLASPGLPKAYIAAVNGLRVGPKAGSCGTAAFFKRRIIVEDIATDPLWEDSRDVTLSFGLKSCWSQPIFNSRKEVIATFANYYATNRKPTKNELKLFERLASLVGIILENHKKDKKLRSRNELFNYVHLATNDAIYDWDLKKDNFKWGESFTRLFGHELNKEPYSISEWSSLVHPDDLIQNRNKFLLFSENSKAERWSIAYRFKRKNGTYAYVQEMAYAIRDKKGKIVRMIGVLNDITEKLKYIETVEEQNKRLKEIAWEQSHSVRAPVARLMWIIDLIKTEELTEKEKKNLLTHMLSSAQEIDSVIRNISEKTNSLD
ncbi:PAS domain-containing protein [Kriegella aquimaris]|uniref:histidine kinase n=1 Tax=Kriegella aquimaris TaxID=192904 RepID=A0A1G9INY3_9FLAO|nr:PAS domain-containing protein [Kriegella aquimaris]SDL26847.1 PAS domain S-box-containing protein [Kriegella aquimaris]